MNNCEICCKIVDNKLLISCCDCLRFFHASCLNIVQQDIEYFNSSGIPYRCDKCRKNRRLLMQLPAPSNPNKNSNNDTNVKGLAQKLFLNALSIEVPDNKIEKCFVKKVPRKRNGRDNETISSSSSHTSVICLSFTDLMLKQNIMKEKSRKKNILNSNVLDGTGVGGSSGSGVGGSSGSGGGRKKSNIVFIKE